MKEKKLKIKSTSFIEKTKQKTLKIVGFLGPGFVTGSADDDPSGIGTYSIAGAKYGLLLTWLVPFQLPLMFAIQEMCARIGLVTGKGLAANMKRVFSKHILYTAILILVCANIFNIAADLAIMAASIQLIIGGNVLFLAIVVTVITVWMEIFISYHTYSKILIALSWILVAYVFTAFITTADWWNVLKNVVTPHFEWNRDFILVTTGFIGTTISPYLFFWQTSQEIEDGDDHGGIDRSKPLNVLIKKLRLDTFIGMLFSQLMTLFIVITCFSSLHLNGITEINGAHEAAMALKPLAGDWAFLLFTIGIVGAGLVGIPVLAGSAAYALAEVFEYKEGLAYKFHQARFFYGVIAIATLLGLAINFIGINPIKALLYAAIINCIASVPLIFFVILMANKKELMGAHTNGFHANMWGYLTLMTVLISSVLTFIYL